MKRKSSTKCKNCEQYKRVYKASGLCAECKYDAEAPTLEEIDAEKKKIRQENMATHPDRSEDGMEAVRTYMPKVYRLSGIRSCR